VAEKIDLPRDELERLYVNEGLSSVHIAEIFGCNPVTVLARLRDHGIPLRPRGWHKLVRRVPDAILEGWPSPELAYVLGLIASDGNLEKDNNCVILSTTDFELVDIFRQLLGMNDAHVVVVNPLPPRKTAYMVQVCDYVFRAFVEGRGLTPQKALTIGPLDVPDSVFVDFLRGELDGDGGWHTSAGWREMEYLIAKFTSKSQPYLEWLKETVERLAGLVGRFSGHGLVYNGHNAEKLGAWLYYAPDLPCLSRKRERWEQWMRLKYV